MSTSRVSGRPRSETTRAALLDAAFRLLVERGYPGLSIEAVASAAGSAKTTVYRWWKTKAELAVDAFFRATEAELRIPETGSAEGDFRAQIGELAVLLNGPRGRALAAMLGGARTDPVLARALGERWLEPRRRWGLERIRRAEAAGELRPDIDPMAALSVLYAPLYVPLLFGGDVPLPAQMLACLDIACAGVFRQPCTLVPAGP